jgi:hypothetical protein
MKELPLIRFGLPVPRTQYHHRYPFKLLKPGDSFDVPNTGNLNALRSGASRYGRVHGQSWTVRTIPEGDTTVFRCWRLT